MSQNLVSVGNVLRAPAAAISHAVRSAALAIDRVHKVPELARAAPVVSDAAMAAGGQYRWDKMTGRPMDIRLNPKSDHLELTTVLEVGHLLDHQAIGAPGEFASISHPRLDEWRKAIDSTRAVQKLEELRAAGSIPFRFPDGIVRQANVARAVTELLEPPELFSRSYAQYISEASDSAKLARQIDGFLRAENPSSLIPYFWAEDDFAGVSKAMESLIIELGWKK